MVVDVTEDAFGDNFFKELAAALKKGDGAVSLGEAIIGFGWFGNDDNKSV